MMKKRLVSVAAVSLAFCMVAGYAGKTDMANADVSCDVAGSCLSGDDMPDPSFGSEEYQKLLALRFDGYESMSIAEYQNKVWTILDTAEYRDLLDRFSKSEALYECRDRNETASFLFYILEPITAEKWQTREFGGAAATDYPGVSDNAMLEFTFTLSILDADRLTVGEYSAARIGILSGMRNLLKSKTDAQLEDEPFMQAEIARETEILTKQWSNEKLNIEVEYVYTPLVHAESDGYVQNVAPQESEPREYPNGTKEDYRSLLALKTEGYQNKPIADFNMALLEWADEDYERMERVNIDIGRDDFLVPLTEDERQFILESVNFSGLENAKYVQSNYTGRPEEAPSGDCYLPQKSEVTESRVASCDLYYQFSWEIADKRTLTVGERDRCIGGMLAEIEEFWENTGIDTLLHMEKAQVVEELKKIAASYSTEQLELTIREDHVAFECMEECMEVPDAPDYAAAYDKLMTYKTEDYLRQSVADFSHTLEEDYAEFSDAYETVLADISPDDENYDFIMLTLSAAVNELYYKNVEKSDVCCMYSQVAKKARPIEPLPGEKPFPTEEPIYNFLFFGTYYIQYTVPEESILTVAERDDALKTIRAGMQKYVDDFSEDELMGENIRTLLADKAAKLAGSVTSDHMKVSCFIDEIEIHRDGTQIVR